MVLNVSDYIMRHFIKFCEFNTLIIHHLKSVAQITLTCNTIAYTGNSDSKLINNCCKLLTVSLVCAALDFNQTFELLYAFNQENKFIINFNA